MHQSEKDFDCSLEILMLIVSEMLTQPSRAIKQGFFKVTEEERKEGTRGGMGIIRYCDQAHIRELCNGKESKAGKEKKLLF